MMAEPRVALRERRKAAGLSMAVAAKKAGYKSKSGWAMVENGTNTPTLAQMVRMADVVGATLLEAFPEVQALVGRETA